MRHSLFGCLNFVTTVKRNSFTKSQATENTLVAILGNVQT